MFIPEQYKVDHLFLLVGENPLPNYVAARTLLKDNGVVYLVFTAQTKSQKDCLKSQDGLSQSQYKIKCQDVDLADNESNPFQIRKKIQEKLKLIPNGTVGLNYTGGTKAMAVHTYRAIEEQRQDQDTVFSYLDPRKLKMWIHQGQETATSYDISLQLSLKELFKLHNGNYWLENIPPTDQPILPDVAAKFADFYKDEDLAKEWRQWCEKQLHPKTKKGSFWRKEDELNCKPPISISLNGLSEQLIKILRENLDTTSTELRLDITQKKGFNSLVQVCEWLDGTWLESYVLHQVQKIQSDFYIKESMMSFNIKDPSYNRQYRGEELPRFEFDVAFIKGYQLFAISCTTSDDHKLCKQKLFEAHLRARQLGGDEARVALVCCAKNPHYIKDEMRFAITNERKIEVFGREHLIELADGIANWININS